MIPLATGWIDTLIMILCAVLAHGWMRAGFLPAIAFTYDKAVLPGDARRQSLDTYFRDHKTVFDNHQLPRAGVRSFTSGM